MADFGLAAQIGRGGGGGGMATPPDPMNRFTQLMQLQQMQQNMMLAQELAGRQREMQPLLLEEKRADIRRTTAGGDVSTEQAKAARLQREEAERAVRVNRGMIDVMDRADRGLLDLSAPDGLKAITDPEIRMAVRKQLSEVREAADKATKANLDMTAVQRAAAYQFVDRFGDGITGPRQYSSARAKILSVDPAAAEFLPDNFNSDNAERLRSFVRDRKTSIQMVNGVPVMVTEGSPVAQELTIQRAPPPGIPAPPATFGGLSLPPADYAMPRDMAARVAGGTPVDVGAMPSGIPGQRLPAAGEPGFVPIAPSTTVPASQFVEERKTAETQKGSANTAATLTKMASAYDRLSAAGGIPDERKGNVANVMAYFGSTDIGQISGKALATRAQTERNELQSLYRTLISDIKKATGMSAQEINSIPELQLMKDAVSNPTQSIQSVRNILNNLNERFGSGKVIEFKSLADSKTETPTVGERRGAVAPAPAAAAQTPASKPTLEEFLAKAKPLNPNASDADLTAYYNRTYGGR